MGDRSKADEQESRKCLVATRQESTKVLRNWVRVAGLLFGRGAHDLQENVFRRHGMQSRNTYMLTIVLCFLFGVLFPISDPSEPYDRG